MAIRERFKNAWNVFLGRSPTQEYGYFFGGDYARPDRVRLTTTSIRTMMSAIYTKIAVDCSLIEIRHVRLDEDGKYKEDIKSDLNYALNKSANIDQTAKDFIRDVVITLFDTGTAAIVPVDTDNNPNLTDNYTIMTMRVGKITQWYPDSVVVELYDDNDGQKKEIRVLKRYTAIIENPFYPIMNEPNSTAQRLMATLGNLDESNQNKTGKLSVIFKLPYSVKDGLKKIVAKNRFKDLEAQLTQNSHGMAYIGSEENVIQLNREIENDLYNQVKDLQDQLYNELGFSRAIFDGTADEAAMLNYQNRTIVPVISAIVENMERKWLSKTAQTQGQAIRYFTKPFSLVPVAQLAEIADKFTRNEIMTSNEMRAVIGLKPVEDPKADELRNANLNHPDEEGTTSEVVEEVVEHSADELMHYGIKRRSGRYPYGSGERPFQSQEYGEKLLQNSKKQNIESFGKNKDHNILYIDGISGSGKSTLALYLKNRNDEVIHLDSYFERKNVQEARKNRNHTFDEFLKQNNFDPSVLENDQQFESDIKGYFKNVDRFSKLSEKFGQELFKEGKRVIMEGVQIGDETLYEDQKFYEDKPRITLTTDFKTASKRAKRRDKNV